MTAPTVNGVKYPQPVDELLPAARKLPLRDGEKVPSRNRLMREFRIGAPKADELRTRLIEEGIRRDLEDAKQEGRLAGFGVHPDPWQYAEPIGPDPAPAGPGPVPDPVDIPLDGGSAEPVRVPADADRAAPKLVYTNADIWGPDPADAQVRPAVEPAPVAAVEPPAVEPDAQPTTVGHPGTPTPAKPAKPVVVWPVVLLALPAFVAIWGGWVGLGGLTGFGPVDLLPGFTRDGEPLLTLNTAITLPIGMETYSTYALYVWLSGRVPARARRFAMWSAITSLAVGAAGQVVYHLLVAQGAEKAPWPITTAVACLPVAVLGMGAALAHLVRENH